MPHALFPTFLMKNILGFALLLSVMPVGIASTAIAEPSLYISYPEPNHQTTSEKIFLIGTAPPIGQVFVNGQEIKRSPAGHFAPTDA